jgi:hypothetical protein
MEFGWRSRLLRARSYRIVVRGSACRAAICHIAQVGVGVEHGRNVGMAEHVRVRPGGLDAGSFSEVPQASGGRAGPAGYREYSAGSARGL